MKWKIYDPMTDSITKVEQTVSYNVPENKTIIKKLKHQFSKIINYEWQHEDTGYICMLPFWRKPNKRWYRIHRLRIKLSKKI